MDKFSAYVGLDVHKETIAVAVAFPGREAPVFRGEIRNEPSAIRRLASKLAPNGELLSFCYEAGPCGYEVYRQLVGMGHDCEVVAPTLIPRRSGDRVKNDRRDASQLARLHRAGELTGVWVPDRETEAMRDLVRARDDAKQTEKQAKQRLSAFLLRQGRHYPGPTKKWTKTHFHWLDQQSFETPAQQVVFQEYLESLREAANRVKALEEEMARAWPSWSLAPVVQALMAMRGIRLVNAVTLLAELGDLTRFESPRQLMAYLGLVPSEASSGNRERRGPITKTGNAQARKALVESAWTYRFPARKSPAIRQREAAVPQPARDIAWKAQRRLCHRFRHLMNQGKSSQVAATAVARELAGFLWALARETTPGGAQA